MYKAKQYINGNLVDGAGSSNVVINPGNGEIVGEVLCASKEQAQEALHAAQEAFPAWSKLTTEERGVWMMKLRNEIIKEEDRLMELLMAETGKIENDAKDELASLTSTFPFYLETAKCGFDETIRDESCDNLTVVVKEPLGVVVGILAWNFPLHNLAVKIGPVLASGCTAVLKPATKTPLSTLYVGELMERIGFPKGVINFVSGQADEIGDTLIKSDIPAMLTLIGSTKAGKNMIRDSVTSIKRLSMELGGNAPFVVTEHADLEGAAEHACWGQRYVASQNCTGVQRILVHRSVYDIFLTKFITKCEDILCGTGKEPGCNMGPMITEKSVERMQELVDEALSEGAVLQCGGRRPENKKLGNYYLPTVLTNVKEDMRVFQEEIFGPIAVVMPYDTLDEAIRLGNATEYGLTGYVWSNDAKDIYKLSKGLKFGTIKVNGGVEGIHMPHGGCKESGIGKDNGRWSLSEYYYLKGVRVNLS